MRFRSLMYTILCGVLFLAPTGCAHLYNGGLGISWRGRKEVREYQKFKTERAAQMKTGNLAKKRGQPVDFQAVGARSGTGQPAEKAPYTTTYSNNPLGALSSFGTVNSMRDARSSPMDRLDNVRRITVTTEGADFDPSMDPSGQVMFYASTRHRETADIYSKRIGQTSVTQLTSDPANDIMPVVSPDGSKIAFASDRGGNFDIYLMDADGGSPLLLTGESPTDDIHPSFSRDGTKLAFCSYGAVSGQWQMVVIDLNKPAIKKHIGIGLFPTWSPTEDKILYQRARQRGTRWFSIWSLDVDASGNVGSPTELAASSNAAAITPEWSASGRHIVFCTVIDPQADDQTSPLRTDIWLMNADGSGRTKLTGGQYSNLQPAWSAAGPIYFVSDRGIDGVENVWSLEPSRAIKLAESTHQVVETATAIVPTP